MLQEEGLRKNYVVLKSITSKIGKNTRNIGENFQDSRLSNKLSTNTNIRVKKNVAGGRTEEKLCWNYLDMSRNIHIIRNVLSKIKHGRFFLIERLIITTSM